VFKSVRKAFLFFAFLFCVFTQSLCLSIYVLCLIVNFLLNLCSVSFGAEAIGAFRLPFGAFFYMIIFYFTRFSEI